jgi:hypothetical protein
MVESRAFNIEKSPFPPLLKLFSSLVSSKGLRPLNPFVKKRNGLWYA